jgi:hypothetical protein
MRPDPTPTPLFHSIFCEYPGASSPLVRTGVTMPNRDSCAKRACPALLSQARGSMSSRELRLADRHLGRLSPRALVGSGWWRGLRSGLTLWPIGHKVRPSGGRRGACGYRSSAMICRSAAPQPTRRREDQRSACVTPQAAGSFPKPAEAPKKKDPSRGGATDVGPSGETRARTLR